MKTRTAVVTAAPGKYEVVDIDLDEPRKGEVTVRLVAAGLCHSDDHLATGDLTVGIYPFAGGHEGAGIVEAVGEDTPGVAVGDHIVFSFLPVCGRCRWCSTGHQNLCDLGAHTRTGARVNDPTSFRMHLHGKPVGQMSGVSTFSELSTVDVRSVIVIDKDIPLDVAALVGCGVVTGWGSAVNSAKVQTGDVVIVMGVGGVGVNAVQGAALAGAGEVIAVDPIEFKRNFALGVGATNAFSSIEEATEYAQSVTNGQGADSTILTVGVTTGEHISQAFASIRKAGTLVVTGVGNFSASGVGIPILGGELVTYQKRIQGSMFGEGNPLVDIPRVLRLAAEGKIQVESLITSRYPLNDIAQGYEDMHAGHNIRGLIAF